MIKILEDRNDYLKLLFSCLILLFLFSHFAPVNAQVPYEYVAFEPERVEAPRGVTGLAGTEDGGSAAPGSLGIYDAPASPAGSKTFIVFRDDDIAPFWSFATLFNITEMFRERNAAHVMGLIPNPYGRDLNEDPALNEYLETIKSDPSIEFALHGDGHAVDEFGGMSLADALSAIADGVEIVEDIVGIRPVSFVPPYHAYNNNTITALRQNNISIISSGTDDVDRGVAFREVDGITHLPATADFYDWDENHDNTVDEIKASCVDAMNNYGGCVILFHHWQFADSGGRPDSSKIQKLSDVLDWAKDKELSGESEILRLKDLLYDRTAPVPRITVLSPSEKTYNTYSIELNVTVSEMLSSLSYNIDGGDGVFLCSDCNAGSLLLNLSLIPDGSHTLSVYGIDNLSRTVMESVTFILDMCVPSWTCGGYGNCMSQDVRYCNDSVDLNGCYGKTNLDSDLFDGDLPALGEEVCDFCVPEWICGGYAECTADDVQSCVNAEDLKGCYDLTNLDSDLFDGDVSEFEVHECDYCAPDWILNGSWSVCAGDVQSMSYYDEERCYERTNMSSDLEGKPDDVNRTCNQIPPIVTVNEPVAADYMSQYVTLNVSTDDVSNCSYALNGGDEVVLFENMLAGVQTITARIGANRLDVLCVDESGYVNDSVYVLFDVVMANYFNEVDFFSDDVLVLDAPSVDTVLEILAGVNMTNSTINITESLFNPTNRSFGVPEIGKYVQIEVDDVLSLNLSYVLIRIMYDDELIDSGVDENRLGVYWFNESSDEWVRIDEAMDWVYGAGVNTTLNYVWANVSHFSIYGVGGKISDGGACVSGNECIFGNCVHSVCRQGLTYCGDSFCDNNLGETCSTCSGDCGGCYSGGGSSRGYVAHFRSVNITLNESADNMSLEDVEVKSDRLSVDLDEDDASVQLYPSGFSGMQQVGQDDIKPARVLRNIGDENVGESGSDVSSSPTGAFFVAPGYPVLAIAAVFVLLIFYLVAKGRSGRREADD